MPESVVDNRINRIAFFDLDGTILSGSGTEYALVSRLVDCKMIGLTQVFWYLLFFFVGVWFIGWKVFVANKNYLKGLDVERVVGIAELLVSEDLVKNIRQSVFDAIKQHLAVGDHVVLVTGAFDFAARFIANFLGVQHVEATVVKTSDGKFGFGFPMKHPFSTNKKFIAEVIARDMKIPMSRCVAYGNSYNDIAILKSVGEAVAVCPSKLLKRVAEKNNWRIIEK